MRALTALNALLLAQRGHLFPWTPVFLGTGVGIYFALLNEPALKAYVILSALAALLVLAAVISKDRGAALFWAASLTILGFCLAGYRAHDVGSNVLNFRYYGPVEGRVVAIDRSASDRIRLTLDQVRLRDVRPNKLPLRVRVSVHNSAKFPTAGSYVMTTGHLMPPQGPVEPGGFDFRRHAWFQSLGAVGYTRVPVLVSAQPTGDLWLQQLRGKVSALIQQRLGGETGGFAAAITTGDRSGVGQATLFALRGSNLAHLLAISGLHMGLLTGFVFAALRFLLCLWPWVALRLPIKKLAAVGALCIASGYLALSGGNVATERAFVMAAVVLTAVILDRRAFSLRAVALAALIVLIRRPESLLSPGFQMSFAATTALVGVFGWIRDSGISMGPSWAKGASALVISSVVAGLATAPFGAAHFNMVSHFGLLANLLSVPVMGILIIPSAVLALCLYPFGLENIGLSMMGWGLDWILFIAHWVSTLDGAQGRVIAPGNAVLPLITLGSLLVILWQGRFRLAGLLPMAIGAFIWTQADRPAVLVSSDGALVGAMTDTGRALTKAKGAGFSARIWLENDGDNVDQALAAERWISPEKRIRIGPAEVVHVIGKRAVEQHTECLEGQIVVTTVDKSLAGDCLLFDPKQLRVLGSLMINNNGDLITAQQLAGHRLWTAAPAR